MASSLTVSINITKIWVTKRPFNETLWLPAYFNLDEPMLWKPVDLSNTTDEKKPLQVQILHNDTHQDPLWKLQLIPKTSINILLSLGASWSFEFACQLLNDELLRDDQRSCKQFSDILEELDDAGEQQRIIEVNKNNSVGEEISVQLSTEIPQLIRICDKKKTWGIVIKCDSQRDTDTFSTWWQQFESANSDFWSKNGDLCELTKKLSPKRYPEAVRLFYQVVDPTKPQAVIENLLLKYESKMIVLMNMLWHKYGSHPLVAMKDIVAKEDAPIVAKRLKQLEEIRQRKDERLAKEKRQKLDKHREEEQRFLQLVQNFVDAMPPHSSSTTKSNHLPKGTKDIAKEIFSISGVDDSENSICKNNVSKKRSASSASDSTEIPDDSNYFQLIHIDRPNHPDIKRYRVDLYSKKRIRKAISLPLLPPRSLVIALNLPPDLHCDTDDGWVSWCRFDLEFSEFIKDHMYYSGEVIHQFRKDKFVVNVDIEWNCPWFDQSKLFVPTHWLDCIKKNEKQIYDTSIELRSPYVPESINWREEECDLNFKFHIPEILLVYEVFLYYVSIYLELKSSGTTMPLPVCDDSNDFYIDDVEKVFPRINFTPLFNELTNIDDYPMVTYDKSCSISFSEWFETNVLGRSMKKKKRSNTTTSS